MKTFNISDSVFSIHGLAHIDFEKGEFHRLPPDVIDTISPAVSDLAKETAGGRIRFRSNTKKLYVKYKVTDEQLYGWLPGMGAKSLIAVYVNGVFLGRLVSACVKEGYCEYESADGALPDGMNDICIHLPRQNSISCMEISVDDDAEVLPERPYKYEKPVVFYGSSITHGINASQAGNAYVDRVCRALDTDYINLGFSGNAKGEQTAAEYIAGLDMSVFVLDYDHNAPTPEYLKETHEPFYKTVRAARPDLPIVMISRPDFQTWREADYKRREVVKETCENALAAGDKNVYFIDGQSFFGYEPDGNENLSDGVHPNDAGMEKMAKVVLPVIKKILEK